jgi:hypothetical protein
MNLSIGQVANERSSPQIPRDFIMTKSSSERAFAAPCDPPKARTWGVGSHLARTCGVVIAAGGLALLTACSPSSDPQPAEQAAATHVKPAPKNPLDTMAHAVVTEKTGAAVDLKYDIKNAPQVGQPLDIELAFIAKAELQSMQVKLGAMPGLTLSTEVGPDIAGVKEGQTFNQHVTATASQPGIYYISVIVSTQSAEGALGRTFSIPLVVGTDAATPREAAATAQKDAGGQKIHPMPAQETPAKP